MQSCGCAPLWFTSKNGPSKFIPNILAPLFWLSLASKIVFEAFFSTSSVCVTVVGQKAVTPSLGK